MGAVTSISRSLDFLLSQAARGLGEEMKRRRNPSVCGLHASCGNRCLWFESVSLVSRQNLYRAPTARLALFHPLLNQMQPFSLRSAQSTWGGGHTNQALEPMGCGLLGSPKTEPSL